MCVCVLDVPCESRNKTYPLSFINAPQAARISQILAASGILIKKPALNTFVNRVHASRVQCSKEQRKNREKERERETIMNKRKGRQAGGRAGWRAGGRVSQHAAS